MVRNITAPEILKAIEGVRDEKVKKELLDGSISTIKFVLDHESAFRALIPDYYDEFKKKYCVYRDGDDGYTMYTSVITTIKVYLCLQTGVVDVNDFRTVTGFLKAGITLYDVTDLPSAKELFLPSIEANGKYKELVDFLDKSPEFLHYFLSMMCDVESEDFSNALKRYIASSGLEDNMRIWIFKDLFNTSSRKNLLAFLDDIDKNNYCRYKALGEAAAIVGGYNAQLPPKELIKVLRDVADDDIESVLNADFKHAYNFTHAYSRLYEEKKFRTFVLEVLKRGGDKARRAILYSLADETISDNCAVEIFSSDYSLEDLSFFIDSISATYMTDRVMPTVFESLFGMLMRMDKVSYHFKTDADINFARDVSKASIVRILARIAEKSGNREYIARLDGIYDTLKEEAQAAYLMYIGNKTSLDVRACAIKFLKTDDYWAKSFYAEQKIKLTYDEAVTVSDYLKSKNQRIKTNITKEFLKSRDSAKIAEYLVSQPEGFKRSVGEEMLESKGKVSKSKLEKPEERYSWKDSSIFDVKMPTEEVEKLASQKFDFAAVKPMNFKRYNAFVAAVDKFIKDNADYEYETNHDDGKVTLGTSFYLLKRDESSPKKGFARYPLGDGFKKLYKEYLTENEIACLSLILFCAEEDNDKLFDALFGNKDVRKIYDYLRKGNYDFWGGTSTCRILHMLDDDAVDELLSTQMLCRMLYMFADKKCTERLKRDSRFYGSGVPNGYINRLSGLNDKAVTKMLLSVECRFVLSGAEEGISYRVLERSYEDGLISRELARYFLLKEGSFSHVYNAKNKESYILRDDYEFPKFKKCLTEFISDAFDAEFERGNLQTPYSGVVRNTPSFGIENYMRAIAGLRGLTWVRSPYGHEKNEVFSGILKCNEADKTDSAEKFDELAKKYAVTEDELLRATLFNPVYVDYTAKYLNIPHLKLAVYWFVAHLNETLYGDEKDAREQKLKEFSDISYPDFQDGAFDSVWYKEMTEKVPADILKRIYDNAKYVTVGGLHKRAQRFFDAVGGRIRKEECVQKINASRNKDYCLIYSLIPVENKADLYERYVFLAEFLRSGKQFGAQRQMSERRTVDIAMQNLARVAGYASVDIFMFEMEAEHPSDVLGEYEADDMTVTVYIDERKFKAAQIARKEGKTLSSLPQKYSKNKTIVELREKIKEFNRKLRRIIDSFENSMNTRVPFSSEQLKSMCREPAIKTVLNKLLLLADGKLCVFADGELKALNGKSVRADEIFIAHPVELKKEGLLPSAVDYIARNNIKQPFKQALREIYTKTEEELTQDDVLRFKGFNVDVKKCVAALKGKGWGVSEDIGLRKVYYRADIISAIFREFDLLYTADYDNTDRELYGISFYDRKTTEQIPVKDVDDITFSETLRDVDLMISISSKSVYDFALAMSTVEVRHAVLQSMIDILRLTNVSLLKDNIKVVGVFGTYTVNIRTGLVFKEGTGCLALDTVYSTDKPLLLDFADEDPMTADIISKAVVLSDDGKIKDPSILRELKS